MSAQVFVVSPAGLLPLKFLEEMVESVRQGAVVVFPTDTVYGMGTSAGNTRGIERIYEIKKRAAFKPLPILIHSKQEAQRLAEWPPEAERLAGQFWPGPLTLVVKPNEAGRRLAGGFSTLGFRVPDHPALKEILCAAPPLASTSANLSGEEAIAEGAKVVELLAGEVDYIVIQEEPLPGRESTVVDITLSPPHIMRRGALSPEEVTDALRRCDL